MAGTSTATFDDCGVRFAYPEGWQVEITEEDRVTTVSLHSPNGPAFALVTLDPRRLPADEVADNALEVMREEYPGLEATPAETTVAGHDAVGHDAEFFALDVTNECAIRCFRTPRRTVLLFAQSSDIESDQADGVLGMLIGSFAETDTDAAPPDLDDESDDE